jgi:hypothetical protein
MKNYSINYNVGSSKYLVTFFDGIKKNRDGSHAADIRIFKNKKLLKSFISDLENKGFKKN